LILILLLRQKILCQIILKPSPMNVYPVTKTFSPTSSVYVLTLTLGIGDFRAQVFRNSRKLHEPIQAFKSF